MIISNYYFKVVEIMAAASAATAAVNIDGMRSNWVDLTVRNIMGEEIYVDRVCRDDKVLVHLMRIAQKYDWKPASIQLLHEGDLVPAGHYDTITQAPELLALTFLCILLPEPEIYDESYYCDVCGQLRFCFFRYAPIYDGMFDTDQWTPVLVSCEQCGGRYTIPGEDDVSENDGNIHEEAHEDDDETIYYPSDVEMDRDEEPSPIDEP